MPGLTDRNLGLLPSSEAVKEPRFLDSQLCKINNS